MAIQFAITPETWPVFVTWFNRDAPPEDHITDDDRSVFEQDFRDLIADALSADWPGHERVSP